MKNVKAVNPKTIKQWDTLFTEEGVKVVIMDYREVGGRYDFTTVHRVGAKNIFKNYTYDSHDYDGEENPYPLLFKKSPIKPEKKL